MTILSSTTDLDDSGISGHEIRRRVRTGELARVRPGYFVPAGAHRAMSPEERTLLKHRAFTRAATVPPVFCLASAALVLGFRVRRVPTRIHTVSPPGRGTHRGYAEVVRHQAPLPESDLVLHDGLHATSAERTVLDCARCLPFSDAVVLADQALGFGLSRPGLEERLRDWSGRRGVRRAEAVLAAMDPRSESVGETLTRLMLAASSLPVPELQWVVEGRTGRYRADFAWPAHRVVLEFDGEVKYADPGAVRSVLREERRREAEIQELGWTVIRIGWHDVVATPEATIGRIGQALRNRGR